jgi:hypothetical protein
MIIQPHLIDVEQMYTNLQHNKIIKSTNWLLEKAKKYNRKRGNNNFTINITNKKPYIVRWGKAYNEENTNLTIQQISEIINYDLQHCYTTIGGKIYKQIIGAPMGGLLSTNYANICCAFDEDCFLRVNTELTTNILGIRQIDDALIFVTYPNNNQTKQENAERFINGFDNDKNPIYKDGLKCKKQDVKYDLPNNTYNFSFIGTHIQIKAKGKSTPQIQTQCKNWGNFLTSGKQKFLRLINANSYTPQRIKEGTIIGEIIRYTHYTNQPILLCTAVQKLCIELLSINYKKSYLYKLLLKIIFKYNFKFLKKICTWLRNIPNPNLFSFSNIKYLAQNTSKLMEIDLFRSAP